ncbi:MAG: hypothetical protein IK016_08710 [Lachnospiraceae bacterium]|nr:hypothetical protein [Lachnospiraceae bacterium]
MSARSEKYSYIVCLVLFWAFYTFLIFDRAYVSEATFSYDASNYLREANALVQGYGMNFNGAAGGSAFFSWWPVGYPVLVAAVAKITGIANMFLASKILASLLVGLALLFFGLHFKRTSWAYALLFLNAGILGIYDVSLSENAFVPALIVLPFLLAKIITEEVPKTRWYLLLYLDLTALFLLRYFGLFLTFIAGLVWLCLLAYFLRKKRGDAALKNKLIRFAAAGFAAALTEGAYLLMNLRKVGYATGLPRAEMTDKLWELKAELYQALQDELLSLFHLQEYPLFAVNTIKAQRVLCFALFLLLLYLLYRRKKTDEAALFILTGLAYDIIFIFIRFRSGMDPFSARFFAPATTLILIGLLMIVWERIGSGRKPRGLYAATALVALALFSCAYAWLSGGVPATAYEKMRTSYEAEYREVHPRSVILEHQTTYRAEYLYFRMDVVFDGAIAPEDTLEDVLARYEMYEGIYLNRAGVKEKLDKTPEAYAPAMRAYLRTLLAESADGAFIRLNTEEEKP